MATASGNGGGGSSNRSSSNNTNREVSHYVVTAHPPGGVLHAAKCNFLSKESQDVVIGKSRRLEVRQFRTDSSDSTEDAAASPFPVVFSCPINGRITSLVSLSLPQYHETALIFCTTDQYQYAVLGYSAPSDATTVAGSISGATPAVTGELKTFASGSLKDDWTVLGTLSECGPLITVDPHMRCLVLHIYDGLATVFPLQTGAAPRSRNFAAAARSAGSTKNSSNNNNNNTSSFSILGPVFHARLEERSVLAMTMLHHVDPGTTPPHLTLLHQDSRGAQHIGTHVVDLPKSQVWSLTSATGAPNHVPCEWLKKSRIDGGSSLLIPVPPRVPAAAAAAAAATDATAPPSRTTSTSAAAAATNTNTPTTTPSGGVVILGQRQITFCALHTHKVMPIPPALILSWDALPPDVSGMPRFLLGDEFGNLHMLTLITQGMAVVALQLDTLGSCSTLANCLSYLDHGLVFCGSTLGDSQLVQIHDEPIPVEDYEDSNNPHGDDGDSDQDNPMGRNSNNSHGNGDHGLELGDTTYLSVVEDYTHLGPIVDFELVPMAGTGEQSQVVTASGSSKSGSLRVIRNGIGMKEYASVELGGIQNMWSLRREFDDDQDGYLVQSFVGETRVLGVTAVDAETDTDAMIEDQKEKPVKERSSAMDDDEDEEDVGGTLEEVVLPGLESNASTLNVSNVVGNLFLQITETQLRLANAAGDLLDTVEPESPLTVAASNEAGQIVVAMRGGKLLYFEVSADQKFIAKASKQMDREVSCVDVHPFSPAEDPLGSRRATKATLCAVGLWDDFTVRVLSLDDSDLQEVLQIHLSTEEENEEDDGQRRNNRNNMMARSLCLITLDFSSSSSSGNNSSKKLASSPGVDMLFVGLGDGTLVSFAVVQEDARVRVQSKKEVSLGTQRINLIPLQNARGGSCVLATGDRPTVIYLAGTSTAKNYNPKLCYSNVNLSPADDADHNDVSRPHAHESIAVNVAAPFFSPLLFDAMGQEHYSLCVADDANLRLGVIDDIQKLHVTTCRLGMAPRRLVHCPEGNLFAVGCIESGIKQVGIAGGEQNMGNCIRFLDDATFDDIHRIDLEPCEIIMSMVSATLNIQPPSASTDGSKDEMETSDSGAEYKSFLIVGTAYAFPDEDEPTKGRVMVLSCDPADDGGDPNKRTIQEVAELQVRGGVYSMCQFYGGKILITVNSKTQLCQLVDEGTGTLKLSTVGVGHHGHILSLFVSSRAKKTPALSAGSVSEAAMGSSGTSGNNTKEEQKEGEKEEQLAIVGDLMRSISLVQYYPEYHTLEEVARDFNANWTTAISMLTNDVYIGAENWNNMYVLRRNTKATSEEVRCRLDTVGEIHLGEMVNKFMSGSLVMPSSNESSSTATGASRNRRRALASPKKGDSGKVPASAGTSVIRSKRPVVTIGSQTLFGTVDGTLGAVLGLDGPTSAFFGCLERAMQKVIRPVGNFSHQKFRAFNAENRIHPSHGFVDGDLVESFLDLDKLSMQKVVHRMNLDGGWEADDLAFMSGEKDETMTDHRPELAIDDVLAVVEEMTMLH